MNLFHKIFDKCDGLINTIRVSVIKQWFKGNLFLGNETNVKRNTRIKIFDQKGKIYIGDNCSFGYNSEVYVWNEKLEIGNNTSFNDNCKIYGQITIGEQCLFASNIFVSSGLHQFKYKPYIPIKLQDLLYYEKKKIIIEDDCWIGFGVVIMPGVYVGKGAIIGSNTVVTKDIFPYTINAGTPGKVIGERLNFKQSFSKLNSEVQQHWPFFYKGFAYNQLLTNKNLHKGLNITGRYAIILLDRLGTDTLEISGYGYSVGQFELFFNKSKSFMVNLEKGELKCKYRLDDYFSINIPVDFPQLSSEIEEAFNIIVFKLGKNIDSVCELAINTIELR